MTLFDYVVITILLASLLLGFWRGVVGEVLTLAGWVAGFLLARQFGSWAGEQFLTQFFADTTLRNVAGWVAVFVVVLLLFAMLRAALRGLLRVAGLGMLDRLSGLIFGLARGVLITLLGVAVAGMTPLPGKDWWKQALLSPYCEQGVALAAPWLPDDINSRIRFD